MARLDPFKGVSLGTLQALKKAKTQYGEATTSKEKLAASKLGDIARQKAGIKAGSEGIASLADINKLIASRGNQNGLVEASGTIKGIAGLPRIAPKRETITWEAPPDTLQQQMAKTQKASIVNRFKEALDKTTGRLAQEEAALTPRFREQEAQIGTQDVMARKRAADIAATQGLAASGAVPQTELGQSVITQGALGASRQQQQALAADIERRRSEARREFELGTAQAQAGVDLASLGSQLAQQEQLRKEGVQQDLITLENQLAQQEQLRKEGIQQDETAKQEWIQNIGQFYPDVQAQIDIVANDDNPSNDWQLPYLRNYRQQKIAGIAGAEAEQFETNRANAIDMFDRLGYADESISQALGVPVGTTTADYAETMAKLDLDMQKQSFNEAQERISNAIKQGQLSVSQGNLALSIARHESDQDQKSLNNQLRQEELEIQRKKAEQEPLAPPPDMESISKRINDLYVYTDWETGAPAVSNPQQLRAYILSLNLDDDALTDQLLYQYGLMEQGPMNIMDRSPFAR